MDGFRDHPSDFDPESAAPSAGASAGAEQVAAAIGSDERRMHVRAYNYWVSLLDGRDFPSIEDLEPADLEDFAPNSVLLDFTAGRDNPATAYIGTAIRRECDLDDSVGKLDEVPSRSLLSRLTDHYLQIIANRAPIGFEAEFVNQRGEPISYRGIMMPFSSDGDTIDFIYGVINWKAGSEAAPAAQVIVPALAPEPEPAEELAIQPDSDPIALENFSASPVTPFEDAPLPAPFEEERDEASLAPAAVLDDAVLDDLDDELLLDTAVTDDAGLADRLSAAREIAEAVKAADGRSRAALYRALSLAYDFAVASKADPDGYAELLEDSGLKSQARAPMTPIAKLVFGIDYDKARLTEFASALAYAERQRVAEGGFLGLVESQPGGLKALVAAERQARRPGQSPDAGTEAAREKLRRAAPIALNDLPADSEFALVLVRRTVDGGAEPVAMVDDAALLDRAIRRAAR
ncbi:hypothetical protein [Sphingomonas sp.]|uniref:PAS domain-containing protein n=1 Tax=Sphingomonas sp. TaxID=28214 RepID=UPI00286DA64A|nr:hypothetical protein [Sphingomonas sp.]